METSITSNKIDCQAVYSILKGMNLQEADRVLIDRFVDKITDSGEYSQKFHEELRRVRYEDLSKDAKNAQLEARQVIPLGTDPRVQLQLRPEGSTNWSVWLADKLILTSLNVKTALKISLDINVIGNIFTAQALKAELN